MDISAVVPVLDEQDNVTILAQEIISVATKLHISYEIIFVNDGSRDKTQEQLAALHTKYPTLVSVIEFRTNMGKAAAYTAGFGAAKGNVIVTLDGDGQDDPKEIPALLAALAKGADVVVGWKQDRKDGFIKNRTSMLFNTVTSFVSGIKLHDYNCGLKAITRDAISHLVLYGELHRYIPVLLANAGFGVTEIKVHHRKRMHGVSKYGPVRFINGFLDLLTVISMTKFRSRPMHLFGYIGSLFFGAGFVMGLYLTWVKFVYGQAIGERPLLLFSVMLMIMGVQIGITGLVGEYITETQHTKGTAVEVKSLLTHE